MYWAVMTEEKEGKIPAQIKISSMNDPNADTAQW